VSDVDVEQLLARHAQTVDRQLQLLLARRSDDPSRLMESIAEVAEGGAPMSPEIARRVVRLFRDFRPPPTASYHLTPQETAVLKLLVEGHHYKTAANELGISTNTVSFHLKHIYEKLQVHSKTEAVAKALRERLV